MYVYMYALGKAVIIAARAGPKKERKKKKEKKREKNGAEFNSVHFSMVCL